MSATSTEGSPVIEVQPENELKFTLSAAEATPKTAMVLGHPGHIKEQIAFKVKTTQPRRYLVRPNQGLISPNGSETIQILLVEKDKMALMQSYQRLGQSALDHSKDKFLVQSCTVSDDFAAQYQNGAGYDQLNNLWTNVAAQASSTTIANKKLHVRHVVVGEGGTPATADKSAADTTKKAAPAAAAAKTVTSEAAASNADVARAAPPGVVSGDAAQQPPPAAAAAPPNLQHMSQEQLVSEISTLRRKYDELVAFSVNLTAERDILNNTLEQTKRDLNREMAKVAAAANRDASAVMASRQASSAAAAGPGGASWLHLGVIAALFWLVGIRMEQQGMATFLAAIPLIGGVFQQAPQPPVPPPAPAVPLVPQQQQQAVPPVDVQGVRAEAAESASGAGHSEEL